MADAPVGVLLMAYGTPRNLGEVEAYYTDIRRGRKPPPELLDQLIGRYKAIGGLSPLQQITQAQAEGVQARLGGSYRVYTGMKHAPPFIADTVACMAADGLREAVALTLAPHYSAMSVGTYIERAKAATAGTGLHFRCVRSWHLHPQYLQLLADRVRAALARLEAAEREGAMVIFSAHSLPERIISQGDPYPRQLHETGDAVARLLGLPRHTFAWQSAGRTQEPWLGPDITALLRDLSGRGYRALVSCPCGFVADHLEVLYDIDIECQALARELGVRLVRTTMPNADPAFLDSLAAIVRERHAGGEA